MPRWRHLRPPSDRTLGQPSVPPFMSPTRYLRSPTPEGIALRTLLETEHNFACFARPLPARSLRSAPLNAVSLSAIRSGFEPLGSTPVVRLPAPEWLRVLLGVTTFGATRLDEFGALAKLYPAEGPELDSRRRGPTVLLSRPRKYRFRGCPGTDFWSMSRRPICAGRSVDDVSLAGWRRNSFGRAHIAPNFRADRRRTFA
jgi:hypothetical protein